MFEQSKVATSLDDVVAHMLARARNQLPTILCSLESKDSSLHITFVFGVLNAFSYRLHWEMCQWILKHYQHSPIEFGQPTGFKSKLYPEAVILSVNAHWKPPKLPIVLSRYNRRHWKPHVTFKDGNIGHVEFKKRPSITLGYFIAETLMMADKDFKVMSTGYGDYLGV
jgi:hypothetical protein